MSVEAWLFLVLALAISIALCALFLVCFSSLLPMVSVLIPDVKQG
jgi:hypothetical protein